MTPIIHMVFVQWVDQMYLICNDIIIMNETLSFLVKCSLTKNVFCFSFTQRLFIGLNFAVKRVVICLYPSFIGHNVFLQPHFLRDATICVW